MGSTAERRANNFNLLRVVAATSVIFSHASEITGGKHDVLQSWIGYSGGWIAVTAFFSISGMLIYRSMVRSHNVFDYLIARCLRILPGLWAMLVVTVLVIGLLLASQGATQFFTDAAPYKYVLHNATMFFPSYILPGVFPDNPLPGVINGSLWTLRFEFTCYLAVLLLFMIGAYRSGRTFGLLCLAYGVLYFGYLIYAIGQGQLDEVLYDGSDLAKIHRLSLAFFLGMVVGRYAEQIRLRWWHVIVAAALAWVLFDSPFFLTALVVAIFVLLFWFAFLQTSWLRPFRRMHDYSYGIYIYAFPVQQGVEHWMPSLNSVSNSLVSLLIIVPLAAASWYLVEKPALNLKSRLTGSRAPS